MVRRKFTIIINERPKTTAPPTLAFICVISSRDDCGGVFIEGYVQAAPAGAKRWQRWLPIFDWAPLAGGWRGDDDFKEMMAAAEQEGRLLLKKGDLCSGAKRVRKDSGLRKQ